MTVDAFPATATSVLSRLTARVVYLGKCQRAERRESSRRLQLSLFQRECTGILPRLTACPVDAQLRRQRKRRKRRSARGDPRVSVEPERMYSVTRALTPPYSRLNRCPRATCTPAREPAPVSYVAFMPAAF